MDMTGLDQIPSGKWRARYRDKAGKQFSKCFDSPEDAQRWRRSLMPVRPLVPLVVDPETGCLIWTGAVNDRGYARHKEFYVRAVGPVPHGLELDHVCNERRCMNPKHMEPVTHDENVARATSFRRFTKEMRRFGSWGVSRKDQQAADQG